MCERAMCDDIRVSFRENFYTIHLILARTHMNNIFMQI